MSEDVGHPEEVKEEEEKSSDVKIESTNSSTNENVSSVSDNRTRYLSLRTKILIGVSILVVLIAIFLIPKPLCRMDKAENRNFDRFFGISDLKNHFTTIMADDCDTRYVYRPALPQGVLKADHSASSFMTLAEYGTGKTLLRCMYYKMLSSDNYFKILILNEQIHAYLERFIDYHSTGADKCDGGRCLNRWSYMEFGQVLLSSLVTELIKSYRNNLSAIPNLPLEEKIDLLVIFCYYYNDMATSDLENVLNSFLGKEGDDMYRANKVKVQTAERSLFYEKPLYTHLKNDLKSFTVLSKGLERIQLLLGILEGEKFQQQYIGKTRHGDVFRDLIRISTFIKKYVKKTPVLVIDGIDENKYFFQKTGINKIALEKFSQSALSQEILSLAMANHFHLSMFYPKLEGIDIESVINRKDKFPVHNIVWSPKSLLNYADYVLQEMNKVANKTRCKSFTNFATLVDYSNKQIATVIQQIPTPRALHFFMIELIEELNKDAYFARVPFQATVNNVITAFNQSQKSFHISHKID